MTGISAIIIALLQAFGLKDVFKIEKQREADKLELLATGDQSVDINQEEQLKPSAGKLFRAALSHIWAEKSLIITYCSFFSSCMMLIACAQYGILVFK